MPTFDAPVYTWLISDGVQMDVGFLIDRLSALMMVVVTFVSLCVHVYTIGYMTDDPGYQRFFSYISLFTFSMLMLVMSNNFMQLFFGWEGVGVVSYLLIGFWYTRPTAIFANLKAFVVNRVGDFGFVLGIAGIFYLHEFDELHRRLRGGSEDGAGDVAADFALQGAAITLICICLFIGAMAKSAQVPLHVWLPDSMEGPTPISALIHAATMVTAGIFMVARMSPLFEQSEAALSFVLVIGATTAFFMGLLGIVNNDIKRVIAYSTLSQLGYMRWRWACRLTARAMFHLMTHAFFKALLFLAAGSVIIGMHHEQDMRKMGGLAKYMPITAITSWIGSLALIGTPFFAGFYSKDTIIEAVGESHRWGATYAYWCVLGGVFVTALYTFRMIFMTFHGPERFRQADGGHAEGHGARTRCDGRRGSCARRRSRAAGSRRRRSRPHGGEPHESPLVVTIPLIALAIPSVLIGVLTVSRCCSATTSAIQSGCSSRTTWWRDRQGVPRPVADRVARLCFAAVLARRGGRVLRLAVLPEDALSGPTPPRATSLAADAVAQQVLLRLVQREDRRSGCTRWLGFGLWKAGDQVLIDGALVNGSAPTVSWFGSIVRRVQNGYLYSYAFWMVIGLAVMLGWFLVPVALRRSYNARSPVGSDLAAHRCGHRGVAARRAQHRRGALGRARRDDRDAAPVAAAPRALRTATADFQFAEKLPWITRFHAYYALGPRRHLAAAGGADRVHHDLRGHRRLDRDRGAAAQYFAAFLIMEGLMIGVFSATDALLFYFFWEAMLIPMFLIIGIWGGPRRVYATIKFFLYTFLGSVFMLVALIYMYVKAGDYSIASFQALPLTLVEQRWIFVAFLAAFAVKVPMWPVHTWLPDAHVEAPTGGSVILAAIMLKMGGYGFLRFSLPITPDASRELDLLIIALSLIAVVYIGFVALVQQDMKKLIAYSSIAHMGFVTLGRVPRLRDRQEHRQPAGCGHGPRWRDGADDFARPRLGRAVPVCRRVVRPHAQPADLRLRRRHQHHADFRGFHGVVRAREYRVARHVGFRRRVPGDPRQLQGELLVLVARGDDAGARRGLHTVAGEASGVRAGRQRSVAALQDLNGREFVILAALAIAVLLVGIWPAPLLKIMQPTIHHLVDQAVATKIPL